MPATGPYGDTLRHTCHELAMRVSSLNPHKVRQYAQAMSENAKTDAIDARVIREFAKIRAPEPNERLSDAHLELRKHLLAREAFVDAVTYLRGALESLGGSAAAKVVLREIETSKKKSQSSKSASPKSSNATNRSPRVSTHSAKSKASG